MSETYTFQVIVDVKGADNLCRAQLLLADTLAQISNRYNIEDPNETHRLSPIRAVAPEMLELLKDLSSRLTGDPDAFVEAALKAMALIAKINKEKETSNV